jgi:hypothetical protein
MKHVITIAAIALFASQANALNMNDLKDAVKAAGNNSTSTNTGASSSAGVGSLSNEETSGGLKEALTQGVGKAVASLGASDGFFGNDAVKIPLPKS